MLVLPGTDGLRDVDSEADRIHSQDRIALWHPADQPAAQESLRRRLVTLGIQQPIEQADRDVTVADPRSAHLSFASGERVGQRAFRGFLRNRGWCVPYMGHWFFIGEATKEVTPDGPTAVVDVDLDWEVPEAVGRGGDRRPPLQI